jgi:DNA polymerase III alpha subunit
MDLWDQIESFAEYGFNKSHAYAYTYISARLLYLKAHYPLEFYTAILMCEKDDAKFREYKLDAKYHGITINPVHINKSRENFHIEGDQIYFGFSNIKSIGEAVAQRIVENQPYKDFPDFLERFGTDATPIKALIALGVFEESCDRVTLRKFAEYYKEGARKRRDRQKRFEAGLDKKAEELRELLLTEISETDPDFEAMANFNDEAERMWEERFGHVVRPVEYKSRGEIKTKEVSLSKLLQDIAKKRATSLKNFTDKESDDDESPITLDQFHPSFCKVQLDDEEMRMLTDELEVNGEVTYPKAESKYYGFQWTHVLETCIGYEGHTIDDLLEEGNTCGPIEVEIKAVKARVSKPKSPDKPGTQFWSVEVEDANARRMFVNIWKEDYTRWQEELKVGNFVCMRVRPPSGGFNTMTFESYSRKEQGKKPPTKEEDCRLIMLELPEKREKPKEVSLDDFQFDAIVLDS